MLSHPLDEQQDKMVKFRLGMQDKKLRIRSLRIHLGEVLGKKVVQNEEPHHIKRFVKYMVSTCIFGRRTYSDNGHVVCVNPFTMPIS